MSVEKEQEYKFFAENADFQLVQNSNRDYCLVVFGPFSLPCFYYFQTTYPLDVTNKENWDRSSPARTYILWNIEKSKYEITWDHSIRIPDSELQKMNAYAIYDLAADNIGLGLSQMHLYEKISGKKIMRNEVIIFKSQLSDEDNKREK